MFEIHARSMFCDQLGICIIHFQPRENFLKNNALGRIHLFSWAPFKFWGKRLQTVGWDEVTLPVRRAMRL